MLFRKKFVILSTIFFISLSIGILTKLKLDKDFEATWQLEQSKTTIANYHFKNAQLLGILDVFSDFLKLNHFTHDSLRKFFCPNNENLFRKIDTCAVIDQTFLKNKKFDVIYEVGYPINVYYLFYNDTLSGCLPYNVKNVPKMIDTMCNFNRQEYTSYKYWTIWSPYSMEKWLYNLLHD